MQRVCVCVRSGYRAAGLPRIRTGVQRPIGIYGGRGGDPPISSVRVRIRMYGAAPVLVAGAAALRTAQHPRPARSVRAHQNPKPLARTRHQTRGQQCANANAMLLLCTVH
jgi:hypothetical protein